MSQPETFGILGSGEFGGVAATFLAPTGATVLVHDIDPNAVVPEGAVRASFDDVATADTLLLALPYDAYRDVVPHLEEVTPSETLVVDVCSVKLRPTEKIDASGLSDRNLLMTHPLFGPQSVAQEGISGKTIVVTDSRGDQSSQILDFWRTKGMNIVTMSADEHDREMATIHVLPFFIGRTLLDMEIAESPLGTGYYGKLLDLMDVERHHSPELFNTIQRHNPYASGARIAFIAGLFFRHAQIEAENGDYVSENPDVLAQLDEHRNTLDVIGKCISALLGLRFGVTDKIGDLKADYDLPSTDPAREEAIMTQVVERAVRDGVPPIFARQMQQLIFDVTVERHEERKKQS